MHDEEEITLNNITKIEGHGSLSIKISDGKVKYAKLKITESKRFYTQAIRGKSALALPVLTSRICGTCSIAHLTACTNAVENAFDFEPSDQTVLLRKLAMYGMMIRDHSLHLFMFCLPDIFKKDSVLDFDKSQDKMLRKAFAIKSAGNNLSKTVAGRAIHATFSEVGRFSHIPEPADVKKMIAELKSVRNYALEFIDVFYNCTFKLLRDTDFVSLVTDDYSFLDGEIEDSSGFCVLSNRYSDYLEKVVIPYSTATGYKFKGREHMVGALARMNLNRHHLHKDAIRDTSKYLKVFPSKNLYHNNLAQAIEILHCIDHAIELLEESSFKEETNRPVIVKAGEGIGLLEAPRGTLFYSLSIDNAGKVRDGSIIVPTQQNQICMEKSVAEMVGENIGMEKTKLEYEIEKLIRAYDPCMSCASHFLKIKWI